MDDRAEGDLAGVVSGEVLGAALFGAGVATYLRWLQARATNRRRRSSPDLRA